ncbi:MAG: HAD family hydrolase [Ruminococcus sp.]|nr:HAD family hydrolase [Ruminococcus sp.]
MYQNYIFDLYGTLIDIRTDESGDDFWETVAEFYCENGAVYTGKEVRREYHRLSKIEARLLHLIHPLYRNIDIKLEKVFAKLYKLKGVNPTEKLVAQTAVKFRKASTKFIELYDGVIDLLDSLKKANKNVYLLSNAQRCFTYPELLELGLVDFFDGIFISSDCACSKPQKTFFDKLIRHYKLDKSKTIMIGNDCITDMLGAKSVGIDSLYIHQDISTPLEGKKLYCNYKIMDGDVTKIKEYILCS